MRHAVAVGRIPRVVRQVVIARVIAVIESRRSPGPTRVLPLCLRRQTVSTACRNEPRSEFLLRAQRAIVGSIKPTHRLDRASRVTDKMTWIGSSHGEILALRHQVLPHVKTLRQRHDMLNLIAQSFWVVRWTAHPEGARW